MPIHTYNNMGQAQSLVAQPDTPEDGRVIQQTGGISIKGAAAEVVNGTSNEINFRGAAGESTNGQVEVASFKGAAAKVRVHFTHPSESLHLLHDDTQVKGRIAYVS